MGALSRRPLGCQRVATCAYRSRITRSISGDQSSGCAASLFTGQIRSSSSPGSLASPPRSTSEPANQRRLPRSSRCCRFRPRGSRAPPRDRAAARNHPHPASDRLTCSPGRSPLADVSLIEKALDERQRSEDGRLLGKSRGLRAGRRRLIKTKDRRAFAFDRLMQRGLVSDEGGGALEVRPP